MADDKTPAAADPNDTAAILDPSLDTASAVKAVGDVSDAVTEAADLVDKVEKAFGEIRLIAAELIGATAHGPGLIEKAGAALHAVADRLIPR